MLQLEVRPKNGSFSECSAVDPIWCCCCRVYLLWISVYTWFLLRYHYIHHQLHQSCVTRTAAVAWNDSTTVLFVARMCCGSHEDYSAAYFLITTWPLQCNPILPLSCAPSVQSGLCVDLPSVEWIMMSSCELGPRPVYIHVASLCGFEHMRAILVYVASVIKFFYSFLKKNYYTTQTRCFKCYMHDYFHVSWLLCEN